MVGGHRVRLHLGGTGVWPARVADRKGHSFIGYFILSCFPLALIIAYMLHDRDGLAAS